MENNGENDAKSMADKVIDIRAKVEERKAAEQQLAPPPKDGDGSGGDITESFVLNCLYRQELGDGELYAKKLNGKFLYNSMTGRWMVKEGSLWRDDTLNKHLSSVEEVVGEYDAVVKNIDDEKIKKRLYSRIHSLRKDKNRNNCVKFARTCETSMAISGYEFDTNPTVLGFPNGILDVTTGKLLKGDGGGLISKSVIAPWKDIEEPAPLWEKTIQDVINNRSVEAFLQRFYGYSLLGEVRERVFLVCDGRGQNGKGLISETINKVLGDYAVTIDSSMLCQNKFSSRSSSGPSPDIMALKGARVATASETGEGQKFDIGKVKWLSGGESVVGRHIQGREIITFQPSHTLILLTNHIPRADASDYAFWARFHRIPFPFSFVDEPVKDFEKLADRQLGKKLLQEASGILAWLVRGFLMYQEMGLCPPKEVKDAIEEQRDEENYLKEYLEQRCLVDTEQRMLLEDLYRDFHDWYKEDTGSEYVPTKNKFGRLLVSEGFEKKKDEKGRRIYCGLRTIS
ncbi:MAG: phage/plasmid primase, P4 family [Pseudomonadota bacterium]